MEDKKGRKKRCTCGTLFNWNEYIAMEKEKIEKFYTEFFNRTVNWDKVNIDPRYTTMNHFQLFRPEYIFKDIDVDEVIGAYAKQFGKNSVYADYDEGICANIKMQQKRPRKDYVIFHKGEIVADLLGWNYKDGIDQKIDFMTVIEGIVSEFRFRTETDEVYDQYDNGTYLSTIDKYGNPMSMTWVRSSSCLSIFKYDSLDKDYGLRRVFYEKPIKVCNL